MRQALRLHEAGKITIIPVILRPVLWDQLPFSKLQTLPGQGLPVTQWVDRDAAFLDIVQGISSVVRKLTEGYPSVAIEGNDLPGEPIPPNRLGEEQEVGSLYPKASTPFEQGSSYTVALLWVIIDHSHGPEIDSEAYRLSEIHVFSADCLTGYGGAEMTFQEGGWFFAFGGNDRCEQAAMAGAHLLDSLPAFFRSKEINADPEAWDVRILGHDSLLEYAPILSELPGAQIMETMATMSRSWEFCITDSLRKSMQVTLQDIFSYKAKALGEAIFSYSRQPTTPEVVLREIESLCRQAQGQGKQLARIIDAMMQGQQLLRTEKIRSIIDTIYIYLDRIRFLTLRVLGDLSTADLCSLSDLLEGALGEEGHALGAFSI